MKIYPFKFPNENIVKTFNSINLSKSSFYDIWKFSMIFLLDLTFLKEIFQFFKSSQHVVNGYVFIQIRRYQHHRT